MKPTKIIYYCTHPSSFILKDIEMLKHDFIVDLYHFKSDKKIFIPLYCLYQIIFHGLLNFNNEKIIFISRFAGFHSVIPSFLSKYFSKYYSIIVLGGTDSNYFPTIEYGNYKNKSYSYATKYSIKNCTHLLPVSRFLIESKNTYYTKDIFEQGVKHRIKSFSTPFTEIFNGFDSNKFNLTPNIIRKKHFVTIANNANSTSKCQLKGVDMIIQMANRFPEYSFTIIGTEELKINTPKNLIFIPYIDNSKLSEYLNQFKYYFQISISEGFPNALCEAMLCGCIPIVSQVGIMPEIIGNTGYILAEKNIDLLANLIGKLEMDNEISPNLPREKIINDYSLEYRKNKFIKTINEIIMGKP